MWTFVIYYTIKIWLTVGDFLKKPGYAVCIMQPLFCHSIARSIPQMESIGLLSR